MGLKPNREELQALSKQDYPYVVIGRREVEGVNLNWVGADYRSGAAAVVSHLAELGHQRFAYLGEPDRREPQIDREAGFRAAAARHGLSGDDVFRPAGPEALAAEVSKILQTGATAMVTETAELATQAERYLSHIGKTIPDDMSVAVFGEPFLHTESQEKWTRFSIPREEMGRSAVRMLLWLLDGSPEDPMQEMLPCTLRIGTTTQSPRQR